MRRRLINLTPDRGTTLLLVGLPFLLTLLAYLGASEARLALNSADKLLPSFATIGAAISRMAFTPDPRAGNYLLWVDTLASLTRLGVGVAIAALFGAVFGILQGLIP